ncbi:MAG: hypothetical protein E6G92_04115 [Alphaproteobacteria bacterium]|nr:MAG: hypothetical protein E6G92_04115 [Alphaproteobacteria bacterium]
MTKRRAPLTFELALTKIAGVIGWQVAAEIVGQSERAVRNWSDPDAAAGIRLDAALKLDVAYRSAGGDGFPLLQCYSLRLEADTAEACADLALLNHKIAKAAREGGEAIAAVIAAAQPGATDSALAIAEAELEESIAASTDTLATLRAGRTGKVQTETAQSGDMPRSAPGRGK